MMALNDWVCLPLTVALVAGAAGFCPPDEEPAKSDKKVFVKSSATPAVAAEGVVRPAAFVNVQDKKKGNVVVKRDQTQKAVILIRDENGELKVVRVNDDIDVTHNGESVSDDRVKIDGGRLIVLGEDGEMLYDLGLADDGAVSFGNTRKGHIGVVLGGLDESLREQLKIDNEGAFVIAEVVPDGPAAKAGIRKYDVVVRVNGQTASEGLLREIVAASEPGKEIKMRVIRQGEPRDIAVKVERVKSGAIPLPEGVFDMQHDFDHEFGVDIEFDHDADFDMHFDVENLRDMLRDLDVDEKHLKETLNRLREARPVLERIPMLRHHINVDEIHEHLHEALKDLDVRIDHEAIRSKIEDAMKHVEVHVEPQVREKIEAAIRNLDVHLDKDTQAQIEASVKKAMEHVKAHLREHELAEMPLMELLPAPDKDEKVIILEELRAAENARRRGLVPRAPERDADLDDRLDRLEERLERLERLLERLAERMEDDGDPNRN